MPPTDHDVAAFEDIEDGEMLTVKVGEEQVLLVRRGHVIHAVGATCPHAGAPLDQGVLSLDRVICPWHKATFCIRTGAVMEPPAVDALQHYDARVEGGRIRVRKPDAPPPTVPLPDPRCFVIVGGGAAGAVAAQTLREQGFDGRIVMLDRDNRVPYDRTLLSKYFLSGEEGKEKSPLQSQAYYHRKRIERLTVEVAAIDPMTRTVRGAGDFMLVYDKALVAVGSIPHTVTLQGSGLRNVFTLRSRDDAEAILAQAERSRRAVVLGTSFIGLEVAASLRERGLEVTVVGQEVEPFEGRLGTAVGAGLRAMHEDRGVVFKLGRTIESIEGGESVVAVALSDNETVPADLVVIGFGVEPSTKTIQGLPLAQDGSIAADACLRVTDHLFAAGDVVRFPHGGEGESIRVEHWRVAEQQGRVAALNMLGQRTPFDAPPVFWTIQYRKRLDYIGHAVTWDEVVMHGDPAKQDFLAYYVKDGRVAAAAGMGRDADTASLTELYRRRKTWTAAELGEYPVKVLQALDRQG